MDPSFLDASSWRLDICHDERRGAIGRGIYHQSLASLMGICVKLPVVLGRYAYPKKKI